MGSRVARPTASKTGSGSLLAHRLDDALHLRALLLAALVRAEALLGELEGALHRGRGADLDELDEAALVRREADDLAHDLLDELLALAKAALRLAARRARLHVALRHDVALVEADGDAGLYHTPIC